MSTLIYTPVLQTAAFLDYIIIFQLLNMYYEAKIPQHKILFCILFEDMTLKDYSVMQKRRFNEPCRKLFAIYRKIK